MKEGAFREIRKALKENKKLATDEESLTKENEWDEYDASMAHMAQTFLSLYLPKNYERNLEGDFYFLEGKIFSKHIEKTLSKEEGHDLTAVEFGGPGSQLFTYGFTKNFFRQTVGVCLKDIRKEYQIESDEKNNHSLIEGDILDVRSNELLDKVKKELGSTKTDLIISRMGGPVGLINKNPDILDRIIRNWYSMLNENGLMFIQFEHIADKPTTQNIIKKWAIAIKEKFPEIDIQVELRVMRLHKRPGSPPELPRTKKLFS